MSLETLDMSSRTQRTLTGTARVLLALHLDGPLFISLCMVGAVGSIVLFSASGSSLPMLEAQLARFALGLVAMIMLAQIPPRIIRNAAPVAYVVGLLLLMAVMFTGDIAMGAQRWLDLGFVRFQPSEIMKLAVPLACAWFLHERPLPPNFVSLLVLALGIGLPTLLIAEQPDLGTSLLVAAGTVLAFGACLRALIERIAARIDVVLLSTGLSLDDHDEWDAPEQRVHRVDHLLRPEDNLAVQTRVIAGAAGLVATYGGFSYLGPLLGVPTLTVIEHEAAVPLHLEILRAALPGADYIRARLDDQAALEAFALRVAA